MFSRKLHCVVFVALLSLPALLFADTMQSASYKIQSDSANAGGTDGSSASYKLQETVGEVGTGDSSSASYGMHAGYQQMQGSYIAITDATNFSLPNVGGVSGGTSLGSTGWTVTTDSPAGYSLSIVSGTAPALKSSLASFQDYTPVGVNPDYTFTYAAASSTFGFSPEGTDIIAKYKDNGAACNTGSSDTADKCWDGFSTTPKIIAQSATSNHPSGTLTTLKLEAAIGTSKIQENGSYTVTLSVTALAL